MKSFKNIIVQKASFIVMMSLIMVMSASFNRCEEESIAKDILLETTDQDGQVYASISVDFDLGHVMLPSINIPVVNPYNPNDVYGEVSLVGGFNGVNEVRVAVNLSEILNISTGIGSLPDGSPIPVYEYKDIQVVQVPIFDGKHQLYFAAGSGVAMMGFALTFKELDAVGKTILGADLIIPFNIGNFKGAAGFFTSPLSGKTGICFFADIGQIIYPSELLEIKNMGSGGAMLKSAKASDRYISDESVLNFSGSSTSKKIRRKFYRKLYKLHRKRSRLHLN